VKKATRLRCSPRILRQDRPEIGGAVYELAKGIITDSRAKGGRVKTGVELKGLAATHVYPKHFGMCRVEEQVPLTWNDHGGHRKSERYPAGDPGGSLLAGGRTRACPPVARYSGSRFDIHHGAVGNHECHGQQVRRHVHGVHVNQVLERRKRQGGRGVHHVHSRRIPATSVPKRAFTVERTLRGSTEPPCLCQAKTPCSIRPNTFSTSRVPASLAKRSRGLCPSRLRFAFPSQPCDTVGLIARRLGTSLERV